MKSEKRGEGIGRGSWEGGAGVEKEGWGVKEYEEE